MVAPVRLVVKRPVRMPRHIKIGHRTYEIVQWDRAAAVKAGADGDFCYDTATIRIAKGLQPTDQVEKVLHEVCHAVWQADDGALLDEEHAVGMLSAGLTQVFYDNPDLVAWMSQRLKRQ